MRIPSVSVCIPVYNGEAFIAQTVESLCRQSLSDIEIVISDNASTDRTPEILEKLKLSDSRIRVLRNPKNIGYSENITAAVRNSRSEIVALYHADDLYDPMILQRQFAELVSDSRLSGVFARHRVLDSEEGTTSVVRVYDEVFAQVSREKQGMVRGGAAFFIPILFCYGNIFCCPSFMTRKADYLAVGGFESRFPSNEDTHLWIKYLQAGKELGILTETLISYRRSRTHASAVWAKSATLPALYDVLDAFLDGQLGQAPDLSEEVTRKHLNNKAYGYIYAARNAWLARSVTLMKHHLTRSKQLVLFPFFSSNGMSQRFPRTVFLARSVVLGVRSLAKRMRVISRLQRRMH